MTYETPHCNYCDAEISWNKIIREKFGIRGPLEPDNSGKHTCNEERKKAFQANKSAEEFTAKQKATEMGSGIGDSNSNVNNNQDRLVQLIEIQNALLVQQSEHLTTIIQNGNRHTDLLGTVINVIDAARALINRLLDSQEYFEKLLEIRYKELRSDKDRVPTEEQLSMSGSISKESEETQQ